MKARRLKIEAAGDRWRGGIRPLIRLGGHWLQRAGFAPECRVEVRFVRPGELALAVVREDSAGVALGRE